MYEHLFWHQRYLLLHQEHCCLDRNRKNRRGGWFSASLSARAEIDLVRLRCCPCKCCGLALRGRHIIMPSFVQHRDRLWLQVPMRDRRTRFGILSLLGTTCLEPFIHSFIHCFGSYLPSILVAVDIQMGHLWTARDIARARRFCCRGAYWATNQIPPP
jgi:hypothetical protein